MGFLLRLLFGLIGWRAASTHEELGCAGGLLNVLLLALIVVAIVLGILWLRG